MKLKTILIGSIILLTTFLIYLTTLDKLVYFVALGDSLAKGTTPYGEMIIVIMIIYEIILLTKIY